METLKLKRRWVDLDLKHGSEPKKFLTLVKKNLRKMLLEQKKIDDGKLYILLSPLGQWRLFYI